MTFEGSHCLPVVSFFSGLFWNVIQLRVLATNKGCHVVTTSIRVNRMASRYYPARCDIMYCGFGGVGCFQFKVRNGVGAFLQKLLSTNLHGVMS